MSKTKTMYQVIPGFQSPTTLVRVGNEDLKVVESVKYLGSTISDSLSLNQEIHLWISRVSYVYGLVRRRVWKHKHLNVHTVKN